MYYACTLTDNVKSCMYIRKNDSSSQQHKINCWRKDENSKYIRMVSMRENINLLMCMNLSNFLALKNPVLDLLKPFWAIEHYFLINQFLIQKSYVQRHDLYNDMPLLLSFLTKPYPNSKLKTLCLFQDTFHRISSDPVPYKPL